MFQWTRRHLSPPRAISDLYPKSKQEPGPLGKQILKLSTPDSSSALKGNEQTSQATEGKEDGNEGDEGQLEDDTAKGSKFKTSAGSKPAETNVASDRAALDRSMTFPSSFKFKIEAIGEEFRDHIQQIVDDTLRREVESLSLSVEKEGKHERIEFSVTVQNSKEITDIFEALHSDERVKRSYG
ncbi:YbeD-like protein [Gracilaria domingensis]|nr:YbeD-like protein [Gracilaria domingensis]